MSSRISSCTAPARGVWFRPRTSPRYTVKVMSRRVEEVLQKTWVGTQHPRSMMSKSNSTSTWKPEYSIVFAGSTPTPASKQSDEGTLATSEPCKQENSPREVTTNAAALPLSVSPPPPSPGGYHIPSAEWTKALEAEPESHGSYWRYSLYEGPSDAKEKVKVHYCRNKAAMETVSQLFLGEDVIGFDMEWISSVKSTGGIRKNVSLIQVASEERIALFHLARFPGGDDAEDFITPTFKTIMETTSIAKTGVAIKGDCTRLYNFLGVRTRGMFELSYLHKLVSYCAGEIDKVDRYSVNLVRQVQAHLGLPLLKGPVQISDWSRDLDYKQIQYAATDAYANVQLYHAMEAKRLAFNPVPPRPMFAEQNCEISLAGHDRRVQPADVVPDNGEESLSEEELVSESDVSIDELAEQYFHVSLTDSNRDAVDHKQSSKGQPSFQSESSDAAGSSDNTYDEYKPQLAIANLYAESYTSAGHPKVLLQPLRAYALWHEQGFDVPTIGKILRKPPIQNSTVVSYLCEFLSRCPSHMRCSRTKISAVVEEYRYMPFSNAQRNFLDSLRSEAAWDRR